MDEYINKLRHMSYRELKQELLNNKGKDKKKEYIIRNVMREKAIRLTNMKKNNITKLPLEPKKIELQEEDITGLVDDILNDMEKDNNRYPEPKKKKKQKIVRDRLNEGLAERLQSEMYINKIRKKRDKSKDFIPPFISTSSKYASFN